MAYRVRRWDNWSEHEGKTGLEGLEAMLNGELADGHRLCQLVAQADEIFVAVFETATRGG